MIRPMSNRAAAAGPRSPFAAAFLSFLFPGLGQAFAGQYARALALAAVPVLGVALLAGLLANEPTRNRLIISLTSPTVLLVLLGINLLLLVYRALVVIDAYHGAAAGAGSVAERTLPLRALSLAGLLAILVVMAMGHLAVARYNLLAYDLFTGISQPRSEPTIGSPRPTGANPAAASPTPVHTPAPRWDGRERLNVLLIGSDTRASIEGKNTDTLIVISIDPQTKQIAMLSLPRDTVNVPLPRSWPAARAWGGVYPAKINGLWMRATDSPSLFPGDTRTRGYHALKGALGELYGLDVKYYVEVDFAGFKTVVDTLGGVIVDVQTPVSDDGYPTEDDRSHLNLYIPAGIQHMNGSTALAYARARSKTNDFDRAERQQRVLLSIRRQADPATLLAPGRLEALVRAVKRAVHTDIPPDLFPDIAALAQETDVRGVRSLVFTPPLFQVECTRCYSLSPRVEVIRRAVREALAATPSDELERLDVTREGARVTVLNGSGKTGHATAVAAHLNYLGMTATVPSANRGRAPRTDYENTVVTVYNGAESRLPATVRALQRVFGVQAVFENDPAVTVDAIVITGQRTPPLKTPP
jgi:LCP family protein required for cell wall assembly